jgi:hypothetical protein
MDDFPAAHSMDTVWHAIDRAGHVAVFYTGENGFAPEAAATFLHEELLDLLGRGEVHMDIGSGEGLSGVFYYDYSFGPDYSGRVAGVYGREVAPEIPLHVNELPPALRRRWKQVRFELEFRQAELVQPFEAVPCNGWGAPVAYLCGDGKTIRPIPGNELLFAAFCADFLAENPEFAGRFVFPDLDQAKE